MGNIRNPLFTKFYDLC